MRSMVEGALRRRTTTLPPEKHRAASEASCGNLAQRRISRQGSGNMSAQSQSAERFEYTGINHVALVCRDMAETVAFYEGVLDMPLVKTIGFPGGRRQHFFFDCGNGATLAFMWFPDAPKAAPGIASQHRNVMRDGAATAHASMNHLAIGIPLEKFDPYVERLRGKGIQVHVINHNDAPSADSAEFSEATWVRSMYFRDPSGIALEFAAYTRAFGPDDVGIPPADAEGRPVVATKEPVPA
jgi:catechol 2,3-dioxygenase-like lactoylglutathione lyase family enzyme